jgi:hypothetical protein
MLMMTIINTKSSLIIHINKGISMFANNLNIRICQYKKLQLPKKLKLIYTVRDKHYGIN